MTKYTIPMLNVQSSQIESIGYHPETKILAVKFKRGGEYRYQNVTQAQYDALVKAGTGVYALFNTTIKAHPTQYPYTRMPVAQVAGKTTELPYTTQAGAE